MPSPSPTASLYKARTPVPTSHSPFQALLHSLDQWYLAGCSQSLWYNLSCLRRTLSPALGLRSSSETGRGWGAHQERPILLPLGHAPSSHLLLTSPGPAQSCLLFFCSSPFFRTSSCHHHPPPPSTASTPVTTQTHWVVPSHLPPCLLYFSTLQNLCSSLPSPPIASCPSVPESQCQHPSRHLSTCSGLCTDPFLVPAPLSPGPPTPARAALPFLSCPLFLTVRPGLPMAEAQDALKSREPLISRGATL